MKLVFDIESDGLYFTATKVHVISISDLEGPQTLIESFSDTNLPGIVGTIEDGLKRLSEASELVGHNIINFDIPALKKIYNWIPNSNAKIFDTLVVSRLLNPDRPKPANPACKGGPHSLEAWGYRVGTAKPSHERWDVFDPDMLRRNRSDVEINHCVYHLLKSEADELGLKPNDLRKGHNWSQAIELEHEVARITTQQEINGVAFDVRYAHKLVSDLDERIQSIDSQLLPNLPRTYKPCGVAINAPFKKNGHYLKRVVDWFPDLPSFGGGYVCGPFSRVTSDVMNLGSMHQVKEYLLSTGWQPDEWNYTDDGERSSPKLTESSYGSIKGDIGKLIKDRLLFSHRRGQILGWISRVRSDGRITAGINPCGTNTGRARHHDVVNVPKAAKEVFFGYEMRSLFTSSEDRVLVGHDADGLELRILAHYMNDPDFTEAVVSGDKKLGTDIHSVNQRLAGLPTRDSAKTFIYALIYGAGDEKLGTIVGGDKRDGGVLRKRFLDGLPALKRLIDRVKRASKKGYLVGIDGRKIWLRSNASALNALIQSAGAIVMKKSMTILDESSRKLYGTLSDRDNLLSYPILKVIDMHDEAQADVLPEYVDQYMELAKLSVVQAGEYFKLRCPLAADAKAGRNWAETH